VLEKYNEEIGEKQVEKPSGLSKVSSSCFVFLVCVVSRFLSLLRINGIPLHNIILSSPQQICCVSGLTVTECRDKIRQCFYRRYANRVHGEYKCLWF